MKRGIGSVGAVAAAAAVVLASLVGLAGSAEAATPYCTKGTKGYNPDKTIYFTYATSSSGNEFCLSGVGAANGAVTAIQRALVKCYGQNISVDGIFGSATKAALVNAQRRMGISHDGVYGPETGRYISYPVYNADGSYRDFCTKG